MSNNAEKSLLSIQEQINKFDNKANSLITIVGIVFALSLGILDTFNQFVGIELTEELQYKFRLLILLSTLYFISFTVELVFLILVVYPRKKKEGQPFLRKEEINDIAAPGGDKNDVHRARFLCKSVPDGIFKMPTGVKIPQNCARWSYKLASTGRTLSSGVLPVSLRPRYCNASTGGRP